MAESRATKTKDENAGAKGRPAGAGDRRAHVPAEIRNVSFPAAMRGYDRGAVDAYVRRVNRVIAELEVTRSPQAAVRHAVERVSEQTKAILDEARESAEQLTATGRAEGDEILAAAKAEAAELVVNAGAESDRVRIEAEQLLADARAEAEKIVAAANAEAAERRGQSEEELANLQAQAQAKMRELEADTATVWKERQALLGDIDRMAATLHEAAAAASARFSQDERGEAETSDGSAPATEAEQTAVLDAEGAATGEKPA